MYETFVHDSLADEGGEEWLFAKVGQKIRSSHLSAAKNMLQGQVTARLDEVTAEQMRDLVASPIPEAEREAMQHELGKLQHERINAYKPKAATVRRRLSLLNLGAEPGPSGLRNGVLAGLRNVSGGIQALQKWTSMWSSGRVCQYTTGLWTTGLAVPIDCGPRAETQTGRKLRPIVLLECLPKFAEAVTLDAEAETIQRILEPEQLGVGTPDGNIILLRMMQAWAEEIETSNKDKIARGILDELEAMAALDLTNAYGLFYRSGAIKEICDYLPSLKGMLKAEWQNGESKFWMRVNGEWRQSMRVQDSQTSGLARPKYQDDNYL
eukprot:12429956-Karenia_brevis.AAC.1